MQCVSSSHKTLKRISLIQHSFGYMGYDTFNDYDVSTCASRCTDKNGCVSFNVYFERDPSGKLNFRYLLGTSDLLIFFRLFKFVRDHDQGIHHRCFNSWI